jgi:N-acetylneuraminate synthase/sialic acid synthase
MRTLRLNNKKVDDFSDCYVIAEIGHNHQGDLEIAKKLLSAARECGVDAVKLQTRNNKELFTKEGYDAPYVNENSYGPTYGQHREYLELSGLQFDVLSTWASTFGLTLFSTPFDFSSADFLKDRVPFFKVASGDLGNIEFLRHIARFGKPMIVSTGGATIADVQRAYDAIVPINDQLCLMQCTASYPADFEILNLRVIETYRNLFPECVIGVSSHDNGISMAPVAYVLGARVIEKHFTLNRAMKGTDHAFSLEPSGMKKMVRDLKRTRVALGDGVKRMYPCELGPIQKMGKRLVAARDLSSGHKLEREDIALKSPAGRTPPHLISEFVGGITTRELEKDEELTVENVV